jgi:hypothetical protein
MTPDEIRRWLMIHPRPTRVVVIDMNGVSSTIEHRKTMTYKALAESIAALEPETLQAWERENLIRVKKVTDAEEPEEEQEAEVTQVQDPESQRLIVFARLLAEGYRHANETAFKTLSDICQSMTERTQALEGALRSTEQIMMRQFQEAVVARAQAEAAGEGDNTDVLGAMVTGLVHKATAPTPTKPNGSPTQ